MRILGDDVAALVRAIGAEKAHVLLRSPRLAIGTITADSAKLFGLSWTNMIDCEGRMPWR